MIIKTKNWIGSIIIVAILSVIIIQSCKKKESDSPWSEPTVNTQLIDFTETTANVAGDITKNGGTPVTESGICWGTIDNPTIDDNRTTDGTDSGYFSSQITGLTSNTTYYVRAYATNREGTGYGQSVSFTTKGLAILTTADVTNVTVTAATSGGNISNDGGSQITARGVCWSTSQNPTTSNSKTSDSVGTGIFSSKIINLSENVQYYVRAYAINGSGVSYGNTISFSTTSATKPVINTTNISNTSPTTAESGGNITSDGGAAITARGICWSTNQNPTITDSKTTNGTGTGTFTSILTGLLPVSTYYVRAYATNKVGTSYGEQKDFQTPPPNAPVLITNVISNITYSTAISGGNITSDGGATITARGVCWSTNSTPTTSNSKSNDGPGIGPFASSITGLSASTKYYVRAYAVSAGGGTGYGNEISFTTNAAGLPILSTLSVSNITNNSASSGGNITENGGAQVTARGVCWSTSPNPTISNNKTSNGIGSGNFTSSLSSLNNATKYYARAYATNLAGTAYGNEITFTTNVQIGDAFQGGKVFYILQATDVGYDPNVQHGLICALNDQTSTNGIRWSVNNSNTVGVQAGGVVIGSGSNNTDVIISNLGNGNNYAAGLARAHNGGAFTDWFLPSRDELSMLYQNRISTGTTFSTTQYWSSSWFSTTEARTVNFSNGITGTGLNSNLYRVRAIRKF